MADTLAWSGIVLVVATTLVFGTLSALILPFLAWAVAPYVALLLACRYLLAPAPAAGAGLAALAVDIGVRASVFLFPRGSTAAIALVFSPLLVAAALPVGGAVGWVVDRAWTAGRRALGVAVAGIFGIALALVSLGFARPDLLPTAVVARRQMLERLGEPRITAGGDRYQWRTVVDRSAWFQAGAFDDRPGEDIAVVTPTGATILDAESLSEVGEVAITAPTPTFWSWYSRLIRLDGRFVVSQTGGGFQDTEVRELDGSLTWAYRPDPTLPPSVLMPADLDEDGTPEWYAVTHTHVIRVDAQGKEVWRMPAVNGGLVALSPATSGEQAWVVVSEYRRQVLIWNAQGQEVAKVPMSDASPLAVVNFPAERSLVLTGDRVRGVTPAGRQTFELPLDGFQLAQAVDVRFAPGDAPLLALVTTAPRDVGRFRLQLWTASADDPPSLVFEELLTEMPVLMRARTPQLDRLLVSVSGQLRALVPVSP